MIQPLLSIKIYDPTGATFHEVPVTDSCERSAKLMGDDYVHLAFKLEQLITFPTYSFVEYNSEQFFLKEEYSPNPYGTLDGEGSVYYDYDLKFYSVANMLSKFICYRRVVVQGAGEWDEPEINVNGDLSTLYLVLLGSIGRAVSRVPNCSFKNALQTIYDNGQDDNYMRVKAGVRLNPNGGSLQTLSVSGENIQSALNKLASLFESTEWFIERLDDGGYRLHFDKCEDYDNIVRVSDKAFRNPPNTLQPFTSGGLKKCEYAQPVSDVPQVIVPFGSDRNMPRQVGTDEITRMMVAYGKRLRLEPNHTYSFVYNGAQQSITTDANGGVVNPSVSTGIEQVNFYEDIYPQGHFVVTSCEEKQKRIDDILQPRYTIIANACDNEGNEQPMEMLTANGMFPLKIEEGKTLSVIFESGVLAGREFEVTNKTTKDAGANTYTLRLVLMADGDAEAGTLTPSGNFVPRVGDRFALFNMKMPQEYITTAQNELAKQCWKDLQELMNTRPEVKCTTDPTAWNTDLHFGQRFEIDSELFKTDRYVSRVISYSFKLTTPADASFSLASAIMQGTISSLQASIGQNVSAIGGLDQRVVNLSRRGWRDASEMSEMLDTLTSEMMLVGVEKNQFSFGCGFTLVNGRMVQGINHFDHLHISFGELRHTQEPYISTQGGLWTVSEQDINQDAESAVLDENKPYYVYAKVDLSGATNIADVVLYDAEQLLSFGVEQDDSCLLMGILSSEFRDGNTSWRVFNRSNGYTQVAGGTITTEQIQDAGRNLIIDFESKPPRIIARNDAQIIGNITFLSPDGSLHPANELLNDLSKKAGGENLYLGNKDIIAIFNGAGGYVPFVKLANGSAGKEYVASYKSKSIQVDELGGKELSSDICVVATSGRPSPKTGELRVVGVYDFFQSFKMPRGATEIWIAFCVKEYFYKPSIFWFTDEAITVTTLTDVMLQEGEKATGYQTATKYLTDAITNGSTEIAGGLAMTNVLMLKNERGRVTAGMSGLTANAENVLLWGGGTYQQANFASKNESYGTRAETDPITGVTTYHDPITTLLKKDGTGKLGVFEIEGDRVTINTDDGKVVIDANDGISCFNPKESQRLQRLDDYQQNDVDTPIVIVTPKELKDLSELTVQEVQNGSKNGNFTESAQGNNSGTVSLFTKEHLIKIKVGYDAKIEISGNISYSVTSKTQGLTTIDEQMAEQDDSYKNLTGVRITSVRNVTTGKNIEIKNNQLLRDASRNVIMFALADEGEYEIKYQGKLSFVGDEWQDQETGHQSSYSASAEITASIRCSFVYHYARCQTIVGYNGLFSYQGARSYLYYKNGERFECRIGNISLALTQSGITLQGLPRERPTEAGTLWRNENDFIKVV